MAKDDKISYKRIRTLIDSINSKMSNLYGSTYAAPDKNRKDLENITQDIKNSINDIITRNSTEDVSSISKLYSRLNRAQQVDANKLNESITEVFSDTSLTNALMQMYMSNTWIKQFDQQIDTVCKYMPKLEEALALKRDAVLSADNYSKEYINCKNTNSVEGYDTEMFTKKIRDCKKKYDIESKYEEWWYEAAKYGEKFIYHVPYNKAIADLLRRKSGTIKRQVSESVIIEHGVVHDNVNYELITESYKNLTGNSNLPDNFTIQVDNSSLLESFLSNYHSAQQIKDDIKDISLMEQVLNEKAKDKPIDITIPNDLEAPEYIDRTTDGLMDISRTKENIGKISTPGCVLKPLKRENLVLIYIEDVCLGYYYIEVLNSNYNFTDVQNQVGTAINNNTSGTKTNLFTGNMMNGASVMQTADAVSNDAFINFIASKIVQNIDAKFVNNNPELVKEIYAVLKHNDIFNNIDNVEGIRCTYLAPEDVTQIAFKIDPNTHRGISDLYTSLIPAMLYGILYTSDTIGTITRGQDKRVYYVKQNVETNISQTLLNVMNQIKKSNFNIRQIENMNNILNIVGRFNDFIIPVGASGDAPIQFEVMQGQDYQPKTDILETLENMAVNGTDVPIELLQSSSSTDFATQYTMTNIRFLRYVYKRQAITERSLSPIMTCIYNSEYNDIANIVVSLPTPVFLNYNNMTQIIDSITQFAEKLAQYEYADTNEEGVDEQKTLFIKHFVHDRLSTYIKVNEIEEIKTKVALEYKSKRKKDDNM